jgi:ATP-binding cassette, subfamily C, bacterial CydCD
VAAGAGELAHRGYRGRRELVALGLPGDLLLARPDASDEELWGALRRARIDGWVATLRDGLETLVGEEGMQLSGGQRQRLVLARALLADRPVLILDEPRSPRRGDPDRLVRDVLATAGATTILLITHRPEGLELVDEIVRLG